jgi:thiosulfate dehydrogenase (quinone) large subunit
MAPATLPRTATIAITVLRVVTGWHFLYEGLTKLTSPAWSSASYLRQARGPLAGFFRGIAADANLLANVDLVTMWGLTLVGLCLMLGLFTRLASVAGIAFLVLFYFANPPFVGYFYSLPAEGSYLIVNKNLVELCALAVILVTGSGRAAGLDRLVHGLVDRRRGGARPEPALDRVPVDAAAGD